jgi:hypothetical protein
MKPALLVAILMGVGLLQGCVTAAVVGSGLTATHMAVSDAHKLEKLIKRLKKIHLEKIK